MLDARERGGGWTGRTTRRPYVPFTHAPLVLKLSASKNTHLRIESFCLFWIDVSDFQRWRVHSRHLGICWQAAPCGVAGAGPSMAATRAGSMEPLPPAHTPVYEHKKHRLSRLLDKLAVQLNNNNNYPTPSWLVHEAPQPGDDAPLDLSVKSPRETPGLFSCHACGQEFSLYDRLVKHIASRHRSKPEGVRAYECEVCYRKFARSDMLTRHARLHSGVKPYSCASCGQVFSRSDHLATHQRTHTGEKPYRCPSCPYAACRRDMITRHMRTHNRRPQPA